MRRKEFDLLIQRALRRIPEPFQEAIRAIPIVVEDWPDPVLMEDVTGDPDEVLYGLFAGTPLTERRFDDVAPLPPVIYIWQGPLEEDFPERRELEREVEVTLAHEIGHYLGFDEETLREYGYE